MISIIIPTYNEERNIVSLIRYLKENGKELISDIIVVDGGSNDNTVELAFAEGVKVLLNSVKSRAAQMNFGASEAMGEILYFVHADVLPPKEFAYDIIQSFQQGYDAGNFSSAFKSSRFLLRLNSWMSKSSHLFFRGGGDLSLFITKQAFQCLNGFDEKFVIMEDFDKVRRIKKSFRFAALQSKIVVSPRKYEYNAYWKVSMAYTLTYFFFRFGASPDFLLKFYKCLIRDQHGNTCLPDKKQTVVPIGEYCHLVKNDTL